MMEAPAQAIVSAKNPTDQLITCPVDGDLRDAAIVAAFGKNAWILSTSWCVMSRIKNRSIETLFIKELENGGGQKASNETDGEGVVFK
jgi:hypothetical protein